MLFDCLQEKMGEIEWSNRASERYRTALWKEPDQKFANVYFVSQGFNQESWNQPPDALVYLKL